MDNKKAAEQSIKTISERMITYWKEFPTLGSSDELAEIIYNEFVLPAQLPENKINELAGTLADSLVCNMKKGQLKFIRHSIYQNKFFNIIFNFNQPAKKDECNF